MNYNIAVLAGDGIGPEVTSQAKKVLDKVAAKYQHKFNYTEALMGACAIDETGNPLPASPPPGCHHATELSRSTQIEFHPLANRSCRCCPAN